MKTIFKTFFGLIISGNFCTTANELPPEDRHVYLARTHKSEESNFNFAATSFLFPNDRGLNNENIDTINKREEKNLKEGHWIYFGKMAHLPDYKPDQKVEEGKYHHNRKEGKWKKYFPNGKTKSEIIFSNNRPDGEYRIYYENGKLQERGVWINDRNLNIFNRFYENGLPQQEFFFSESGKRNGNQKYFHKNGKLMMSVEMHEGKKMGELRVFYENGELKSTTLFGESGLMREKKSKEYRPVYPEIQLEDTAPEFTEKVSMIVSDEEKPNGAVGVFNGEGNYILYNRNRQISQKGFFTGGRLKDGAKYLYDINGMLSAIEIYYNFRFIGEGVIEEEYP